MKTSQDKPFIVLVHGAFADGSCWQKIIPLLEKDGFTVMAVQNPLKSLADDVATTRRAITGHAGSVIVVGHSYGGAVITDAAAGNANVKALVYVAAWILDVGESLGGLLGKYPPPPLASALVPDAAGFLYIDRTKFHEVFAHDITVTEAAISAATQKPIAAGIFGESVTTAAWKTVPTWVVVSKQDRAINTDLERFMAKRTGGHITEIEASHVPFLSQPDKIVEIIKAAAAAG